VAERKSLAQAVGATRYPGRGIIAGLHKDGKRAVAAYFIMGRSANSRNRVFELKDGALKTRARDEAAMVDPSLILYTALRVCGSYTIVTNGNQTDTIAEAIAHGGDSIAALCAREYEPDAPNFTPRISAVLDARGGGLCYQLSILKRASGEPASCQRFFYQYDAPQPGVGHFIHTYSGDGEPLPSFSGEPEPIPLGGSIDEITGELWEYLDEENKVALYVRTIDLPTGCVDERIVNKYA